MIEFYSEGVEKIGEIETLSSWLVSVINSEDYKEGEITYVFCDDDYLLDINVKYLKHNYLTDIISFDYTLGKEVSGDIFISVDRVRENALIYSTSFQDELHRVMVHGILHFCGYNDKTDSEKELMRSKEDYYLSLRTF